MQKYFSKLKRSMAAFLAVLTLLTCAPLNLVTTAFAAAPTSMKLLDFPPNGGTWTYYPAFDNGNQIVNVGSNSAKMHQITFNVDAGASGSGKRIAFCDNHSGRLGTKCEGYNWTNPQTVSDPIKKFVLTIGYAQIYGSKGLTDNGPGSPTMLNPDTLSWSQAATQAYLWALQKHPDWYSALLDGEATPTEMGVGQTCPDSYNEAAKARYRLAKERVAACIGKYQTETGKSMQYKVIGTGEIIDCSTAAGMARAIHCRRVQNL